MIECIYTIGGYGYHEEEFFAGLVEAKVDVFVDIRMRRGMRGKKYSFLNSSALQRGLEKLNISYVHMKELAPNMAVRAAQKRADEEAGILKRSRLELSCEFRDEYQETVLKKARYQEVLQELSQFHRPCFFCVESAAAACHRSLVSEWLHASTGIPVRHLEAK